METQEPKGGSIINIGSSAIFRGMRSGAASTVFQGRYRRADEEHDGVYGPRGIYCSDLLLGDMEDTNIAEAMMTGGYVHLEMYQAVNESQSKFDPATKSVPLADMPSISCS